MIRVLVNPASKQGAMLPIPRDLWVPLSTGGTGKIDGAYSYGRASAAIATVQRNFGVHIDDYAWIGLKGLVQLHDQLGGVVGYVGNPVLDGFYPNDSHVTYPYGHKRGALPRGCGQKRTPAAVRRRDCWTRRSRLRAARRKVVRSVAWGECPRGSGDRAAAL